MEGRIVALNCGMYSILSDGTIYNAPARGIFRKKGDKPVVGDLVCFSDQSFVINEVKPRVSYLKRPVIANIDQMLIVQSLAQPEFSYLLTFKYLTYANMNGIKAKIILTKPDKLQDNSLIEEIKNVFNTMNIEVYVINNKTKQGIEEVKHLFDNHITCLIGQTGVGKSSLLNSLDENYERKVGEYSFALHRGKHQTKEVILLPFAEGFIADTPGFSSLDLNLFKEDLAKYYPGFSDKYTKCYFSNCLHISEHKCVVKDAVNAGEIPNIAYECYLKLSEEAISEIERYSR